MGNACSWITVYASAMIRTSRTKEPDEHTIRYGDGNDYMLKVENALPVTGK